MGNFKPRASFDSGVGSNASPLEPTRTSLGAPFELRRPKEARHSTVRRTAHNRVPRPDSLASSHMPDTDDLLASSLQAFNFADATRRGNSYFNSRTPEPPSQPIIIVQGDDVADVEPTQIEPIALAQLGSQPRDKNKESKKRGPFAPSHHHSRSLQLDPIQEVEISLRAPSENLSSPRVAQSSPNSPVNSRFRLLSNDVGSLFASYY